MILSDNAVLSPLRMHVLAAITRPMSSKEIRHAAEASGGSAVSDYVTFSLLERLERDGWVHAERQGRGRGKRTFYTRTELGDRALQACRIYFLGEGEGGAA